MAKIIPFRALQYNLATAGDISRLVTQPYDKITPEMQSRYYEASPHNLVRIILGKHETMDTPEHNVYTRAAASLQEWIAKGILVSAREPAFFAYNQDYRVPGTAAQTAVREGLIALLRLEDYSAHVVHRHEETLAGPKADRMNLLKAARAHFGQVFLLYSDPSGEIERILARHKAVPADRQARDEMDTTHSLWRVSDEATIERLAQWMKDKPVVIADGHHRYETALAYRDALRAQGSDDPRAEYVMATLVRLESSGLTILPTHRLVHNLKHFDWGQFLEGAERYFDIQELRSAPTAVLIENLRRAGQNRPAFLAHGGENRIALLWIRKDLNLASELPDLPEGLRRLDVVLLHRLALEKTLGIDRLAVKEEKNLRYVREAEQAIASLHEGKAQLAFLMNPTPAAAVWSNALEDHPLPQKSTDFYPKMLSGLTIYWLDNPAGI